jgi:tRNA (cmo5U34)-methyltransferase
MAWDPDEYPASIREWIHDYDDLQEQVAKATTGIKALTILDLGVGTGETAKRVLQIHSGALLIGVDSSPEMLRGAADALPGDRITLVRQELSAPIPDNNFDLVISALAIHHLEGSSKAKLFRDVARHLAPGGRFVMGDVVVPEDPADVLIENEAGYDFPSRVDDQLRWMKEAGLTPEVVWSRQDLAVIKAERSNT